MSIEKRNTPGGGYYVKWYPNGRNHPPERIPFATYAEAAQCDESLKQRRAKAPATVFPRLDDVAEEYLTWCWGKWSAVTMAAKERRLQRYVLPFFGKYRAAEINQHHLDQYAAGMKKWMYATDHAHLFAMISWMVSRNYAHVLTWKPERVTGHHAVKQVPHPADIVKAIDAMRKEKYRILFKLMLFTGLRWNEARNVRWENVDTSGGTIRLKEIVNGPQDVIHIPDPLLPWFKDNQKGRGWVFESDRKKGHPVKNLWQVLERASTVCGTHLSTHTFRHASATYLYEATNDIYQVQAHLRHTKVTTSQIYARMSISRKKGAVDAIIDYTGK
ncbi:MAG: tyrosine-type recombinase/integrase [Acidithiobacillus sp.]|nr:tyrosine-type recombinase/integrase [Acidithiobacillus sp.]